MEDGSSCPRTVDMRQGRLMLRYAQALSEVDKVQRLDTATWPEGYKRYKDLYALDEESIVIAAGDDRRVASFVGLERICEEDLGTGMPMWDHDPRSFVRPDGDVWYITGHVVAPAFRRSDLSRRILGYTADLAKAREDIDILSVIVRVRHPTLGSRARQFWESNGFEERQGTEDPLWRASPSAEDRGAVIYQLRTGH